VLPTTNAMHLQRDRTHGKQHKDTTEMPLVYICALSKSQPWWKDIEKTPVMFFLVQSIAETTKAAQTQYTITVLLGVDNNDTSWETQWHTFEKESMNKYGLTVRVITYPKPRQNGRKMTSFRGAMAKLGAGMDNELGGSAPHQCR